MLIALVTPVARKRKQEVVELVAPIDASAPAPTNRPSTAVSTMEYISWNTPPTIIGSAKRMICRAGLPRVISPGT